MADLAGPHLVGTVASAVFLPERLERNLPAFVTEDGIAISYRTASVQTGRLIEVLAELGLTATDRVAFMAPRGPAGVLGFLAISSVSVCCPFNPKLRSEEFAAAAAAMHITALVDVGAADTTEAHAVKHGWPTISLRVSGRAELEIAGLRRGRRPVPQDRASEIALMMQTSGTTSTPKLVALSHANVIAACLAIRDAFALDADDHCLNPMPLHHVHGLISAGLASLVSGSKVTCTETFAPEPFERLLRGLRPTWFTGSPAMQLALLDHFAETRRRPRSDRLRFFRSSSAPLPSTAIHRLEEVFGAPLIETYGLTETASMICSNPLPPAARKLGSVGIPFGAEIRIGDEAGAELEANAQGEILVRGPSVINHYDAHVAQDENFVGDWLRTGDIGLIDDDGYLFIVGRRKELIKRGGLSVYPAEIDGALVAHPSVAEAVAFAVSHPTVGEELVAAVVPRAGATIDGATLRDYVAARLSTYKVPTEIIVVEQIPKSDTGKILRREMPDKLEAHLRIRNEPARTAAETSLHDAWMKVLDRSDFGVTDNVFLLGGDPLRADRVGDIVRSACGAEITVRQLLANPRIRDQAMLIGTKANDR